MRTRLITRGYLRPYRSDAICVVGRRVKKEMGGRGGVEKGSVEEKRGCGHTEAEDDSTDGSEEKREGDTSCYRVRAIIRSQGSG